MMNRCIRLPTISRLYNIVAPSYPYAARHHSHILSFHAHISLDLSIIPLYTLVYPCIPLFHTTMITQALH
jgi:hypothetical protein